MLRQGVEVFSENIEKILGSGCKGVKFELYDDTRFKICSELTETNGYRGVIKCSRLLVIGTYQMFYGMDYSNIVSDGKNIDNIRLMLFNMSMMCMFYHELTHIYKGHLKLYNIWKNEGSLEQHCLDIQTLEWDADNYAATLELDDVNLDTNLYLHESDIIESEMIHSTMDDFEDEDAFDENARYCPDCGCKMDYENDMGAFCIDCAPNH